MSTRDSALTIFSLTTLVMCKAGRNWMQQITLTSKTCIQLKSNSSLSFLSVHFRASITIANTRNLQDLAFSRIPLHEVNTTWR